MNGRPKDPSNGAGIWGDFNCDLPYHVVENMLDFVSKEIKPEMLFWTGDNVAHDVWLTTNDEVIEYTTNITATIKKAFTG